jgi:hypothetical protein
MTTLDAGVRPRGRKNVRVRVDASVLSQVTSKKTLQCVQVTDAPADIVQPSVRLSVIVRVTTLLYVDVWRLIFLKLSLPRDGVRGCSAPCWSMLYVRSFFKNGTDLTMFVMLQGS